MGKAAAMSGNTAMAGNLLQDMEDTIAKLKQDLESLKGNFEKHSVKVNEELNYKATKEDLASIGGCNVILNVLRLSCGRSRISTTACVP